jgi:hypothetical protein
MSEPFLSPSTAMPAILTGSRNLPRSGLLEPPVAADGAGIPLNRDVMIEGKTESNNPRCNGTVSGH